MDTDWAEWLRSDWLDFLDCSSYIVISINIVIVIFSVAGSQVCRFDGRLRLLPQ